MTLQRIAELRPAWGSTKGRGCHNAELVFCVVGPLGSVNVTFRTKWHLPANRSHIPTDPYECPTCCDASYHWLFQLEDDNTRCSWDCKYSPEGWGGQLRVDKHSLAELFVAEGTDYLWPELESHYATLAATVYQRRGWWKVRYPDGKIAVVEATPSGIYMPGIGGPPLPFADFRNEWLERLDTDW